LPDFHHRAQAKKKKSDDEIQFIGWTTKAAAKLHNFKQF